RTPRAPAVRCGHSQLTYEELGAYADRVAEQLRALGVGRETRVGVYMDRGLLLPVSLLAALKAGATYVPLDPAYPADHLAFMIEDANVTVVISEGARRPRAFAGPVLFVDRLGTDTQTSRRDASQAWLADGAAYILYTSGSSGRSKGVIVTHRGLTNYVQWAASRYAPARLGSVVHTSISFDLTVTSLYVPLVSGGCLDVYADGGDATVAEPMPVCDLLKVTPAHLSMAAHTANGSWQLGPSAAVVVGGESLSY